MMEPFSFDALPGRVVFGVGSRRELPVEVDALGSNRVVIVAGSHEDALAAEIRSYLGDRVVGRIDDVVQHVPVSNATAAIETTRALDADLVVSVGGGSATGLGKVIALEVDVKLLAVPTTYAGSEMTTIWGRTDGDHKQTGKSLRVKPSVVIYDPELTLSLPPRIAGPSGMNALAHSVEALYGPGANPIISMMALESIRVLASALPRVCVDPGSIEARTDALYGAYLAGVALASGGTALHHKTCHVLGGMFDLNHGDMNATVLGHALAYCAPAIPEVMDQIGVALGTTGQNAPGALFDLATAIEAPTNLESIGMPEDGINEATHRIVIAAAENVRPPENDRIQQMLENAFHGRRPV